MPGMNFRHALVLAIGALVVGAPAANAATASLNYTSGPSGGESFLHYKAAPGERNKVVVAEHDVRGSVYTRFVVTDRGAHRMHAGRGCSVVSRKRVSCKTSLPAFTVETGDRNDRIDLRRSVDPSLCDGAKLLSSAAEMQQLLTREPDEDNPDPETGFSYSDTNVDAGAGNDRVIGSCAEETIYDGAGSDVVTAGDGNDGVVSEPDGSADRFDLGAGNDAISYGDRAPVAVDLGAGTAGPLGGGEVDTVQSAEVAEGGAGADHLVGGAAVEGFLGNAGDDRVESGPGPDFVACGDGTDVSAHDTADLVDGCETS
jgi:hypothetical protein